MSQPKKEGSSSRATTRLTKRAHEKQNMQGLNQRLEYYVQYQQKKQREFKKLEQQTQKEREGFQAKLKAQQAEHARQLQEWKNERRKLEISIAEDKNSSERFRRECEVLKMSKDTLKQDNRALEKKCNQFENSFGELSSILQNTKNGLANAERRLANKCKEFDTQEHQLIIIRDQNTNFSKENARLVTRLKEATEDLSTTRKEKTQAVEALNNDIAERKASQKKLESELRGEFQKKLEEFISQRRQQYEKEKEEWMRVFKEEYNRKIVAYKEANADYAQQIEQLKEDKATQDDRWAKSKSTIKDLQTQVEQLESSEVQWRKKNEVVQRSLRETRSALQKRNQEYEILKSENVNLESEISQYEEILGGEENRCFSPGDRPGKKRKLSDISSLSIARSAKRMARRPQRTPKVEPKSEMQGLGTPIYMQTTGQTAGGDYTTEYTTPGAAPSSLAFSSMDLEGACLEIKNDSTQAICLKGWRLTNKHKTKELQLPADRTLQPQETLRIVIGPDAQPAPGDVHWAQDVWSGDDVDQACLFDSKNKLKSLIEIGPDMITGAMGNDRGGCLIM